MNVKCVLEANLCLSCEICNAVCSPNAIKMEKNQGQFLPKIDENKCINCEECIELCPGIDMDNFGIESEEISEDIAGKYLDAYSAFTKKWDIWEKCTSGGLISNLLINMLNDNRIKGAFVLPFDTFDGSPARLDLVETREEVLKSSKSKYVPASVYNVIKTLKNDPNPNYAIVGTPCQIRGIKKFIGKREIEDDNLIFFGLFCEGTLNFNFIKYLENKYSEKNEKIVKLDFRNKEKKGWPGHVKLYFNSGRELTVDREKRIKLKDYFKLERCLYCLDKLNSLADISFGDCYIAGKECPGRSSIIVRTEKGNKVWKEYCENLYYEKSSIDSIKRSQSLADKKKNLQFQKILKKDLDFIEGSAKVKINSKTRGQLTKRRRQINYGKNCDFRKIDFSLSLPNFKTTFEIFKAGTGIGTFFLKDFIKDIFRSNLNQESNKEDGDNVVIVGGEFFNKGAQAMTFTVIDEIKQRFPEKNIYVFSSRDFEREEAKKEIYNFDIMPWKLGTKINILSQKPIIKLKKIRNPELGADIKDIIKNSSFIIDINGYALSSQMANKESLISFNQYDYLLNIMVAKKFNVPFYIFPQSIGPFNYSFYEKIILYPLLKKYLRYPEKIYPREKEGQKSLEKFTRDNIKNNKDIVLLNDSYEPDNLFKGDSKVRTIDIDPGSVGIIPNSKVMERIDRDKIYSIYNIIIEKLLEKNKEVYLIRHSHEDFQICREIKDLFSNNEKVNLIVEELNAIELEALISQLDFVVASRYHSIIHAYKNGIPALVIGWAVKYYELLKDFDQLDYFFDSRSNLKIQDILESLEKLDIKCKENKDKIKNNLKNIKSESSQNIFDQLALLE